MVAAKKDAPAFSSEADRSRLREDPAAQIIGATGMPTPP